MAKSVRIPNAAIQASNLINKIMVSRRNFIKMAGAVPAITLADKHALFSINPSRFYGRGPAIRRIELMNVTGSFYRFVGMNSYDTEPKGINKVQQIARITLADGTEGLTVIGYTRITDGILAKIKELIGKDPFGFYNWKDERIAGVAEDLHPYFYDADYSWIEGAILDALGKVLQVPVWKLFGDAVKAGIDTYDGTLYFEEISLNGAVDTIADIGKRIKNDGYTAIKMKLGRPSKWLKGEAGVARDIDVFIALREAVGWNFNIMTDANNGYKDQFEWAVKLMKACAPYEMYWMEELFPEDKSLYLKLRETLLQDGFFIPIAEGENIRRHEQFTSLLEDGVYNFLQPDMRTCGMSYILLMAHEAKRHPHVKLIPHNWQSQMGLIMSLHAAKISANINFVEDDRFHNHALSATKYQFKGGQWFIPDEPGWGVKLVPDYKQFVVSGSEVVIE